jgi:hypothetical protein
MFKRVYADKLANLFRTDLYLTKSTKFKQEKKLGDSYEQPVILSHEHGFTFGGTAGTAYALNEAISGSTGNARVAGYETTLKGLISRATIERAMSNDAAFFKGTKMKVQAMLDSHAKELEWNLMYGQSATGWGTIASISGTSTTRAVVISAATWCPNRWQGMIGALIDIYESTTKRAGTVDCSIVSVDLSTRTVNISGDATELTAVDSAITGSDTYILRKGEYGNVAVGLDKITTTSSGNLFGLSTDNELWKASTYSCGSANISMEKILEAVDQAFVRGCEGDVTVLLPSASFIDLVMDEVALRRHGVGKTVENGFEKLAFDTQSGKAKIVVGRLVKDGEGFVFPESALCRIGAYDGVKFEDAFGEVFWPVSGYNGYEMRSYSDQALFSDAPGQIVKLTSITN